MQNADMTQIEIRLHGRMIMKRAQLILFIFALLFLVIPQASSQLLTPNVFAIRGTVYASDSVTPAGDGFTVTVENLTKGLKGDDRTGATAGPSRYVVTFVNFNQSVADVGDLIQATVTQAATGEVLATAQATITPQTLGAGFLELDINFRSQGSQVFATCQYYTPLDRIIARNML
jgi:hypothetical protein